MTFFWKWFSVSAVSVICLHMQQMDTLRHFFQSKSLELHIKKKSPFMPHDEFSCFVFNDESYHSENHYLLMSFFCQVTDKYSEWMLSDYCFTEFC